MKNTICMYAQHLREKHQAIYALLDTLSNEEREKDRGSYYKSISGLFRHCISGMYFFLGIYKTALEAGSAAAKTIDAIKDCSIPDGALTGAQWTALKPVMEAISVGFVDFAAALRDDEFNASVNVEWYGGNPPAVPLSFMIHQLIVHTVHHQGQISQILDEMNIENNYSGINVKFIA
ncbi:MAG: damage-inducible protein DinB [Spirochaetaceae bacterium]|nr:damage-inducible protein DinB [Spirochaetaceae bacterium]